MPLYTPGRRRAIVLLLLTSVLLLTLDLRGNAVLDAVRAGYNKVLEPFESAADVVTRPIRNAWRGITDYEDKAEEVERLREQLDAQRADQISAQATIQEHNELLALNNLPALSDYENVVATVVGASPTNIDQVIEIDKGRDDGIDVGMAVVSSAGLVGKITTPLLPDRAYVMLLSDLQYATQVKVVPGAPPADDDDDQPDHHGRRRRRRRRRRPRPRPRHPPRPRRRPCPPPTPRRRRRAPRHRPRPRSTSTARARRVCSADRATAICRRSNCSPTPR